jgi:hypothetical protein
MRTISQQTWQNFWQDESTVSPIVTRSFPVRTICQSNDGKPIELSNYFDEQDESNFSHEFLNGFVYALPSRDGTQDLLLKQISSQLEQQQLKDVFVLPLDIRVQTPEPTHIYYPGLCLSHRVSKPDQAVTREPIVIIELVTPTTERMILHEKAMHYQRIPSSICGRRQRSFRSTVDRKAHQNGLESITVQSIRSRWQRH